METGSAITWKYPSVVLKGDDSVGEFYSVALTNNMQQADTGTKMVHVGKNTRSRIVSKGISAGRSQNCYRGLVQVCLICSSSSPIGMVLIRRKISCILAHRMLFAECSSISRWTWQSMTCMIVMYTFL